VLTRELINQQRFAPDLLTDRDLRIVHRLFGPLTPVTLVLPAALGERPFAAPAPVTACATARSTSPPGPSGSWSAYASCTTSARVRSPRAHRVLRRRASARCSSGRGNR
jgi:hypothetical protein